VSWDWIILGGIITVATTIPIVLSGRNVLFGIQWDRYTYQSLLGVALFIGGLVFYALSGRSRWVVLSMLLIAGVVTQFLSADYYRTLWKLERMPCGDFVAPKLRMGQSSFLYRKRIIGGEYESESAEFGLIRMGSQTDWTDHVQFDLGGDGATPRRLVRGRFVLRNYGKNIVALSLHYSPACISWMETAEQSVSEPFDVQALTVFKQLMDTSLDCHSPPNDLWHRASMTGVTTIKKWFGPPANGLAGVATWRMRPVTCHPMITRMAPRWAYIHVADKKQSRHIATLIRVNKTMHRSLHGNETSRAAPPIMTGTCCLKRSV
jgi:hypothetical protein